MTSKLDLAAIKELLDAHKEYLKSTGYKIGQPPKNNGKAFGGSIYEACFVALSARLEAFVNDEFERVVRKKFLHLKTDQEVSLYIKKVGYIGNPHVEAINAKFLYVGIVDVMTGFSWAENEEKDKKWLKFLNNVRNKFAHGNSIEGSVIDGHKVKYTRNEINGWCEWLLEFSRKFPAHLDERLR